MKIEPTQYHIRNSQGFTLCGSTPTLYDHKPEDGTPRCYPGKLFALCPECIRTHQAQFSPLTEQDPRTAWSRIRRHGFKL